MKKENYSINRDEWNEAKDWGWGISVVERFKPVEEDYPKPVKAFIRKRCPVICQVFYDSIQDGLVSAGLDSDHAIETTEEILAMVLDELLIDLAHEFYPSLLQIK